MNEIRITKKEFRKRWRNVLEGIAVDLTNELRRACPVDSGALRNSIKHETKSNGFVISMLHYALYVEFGTPPHIIRPKNAQALHWKGENGQDVFATEVHHPGTRPNPFIRTTLRTKFKAIVAENIKRHLG